MGEDKPTDSLMRMVPVGYARCLLSSVAAFSESQLPAGNFCIAERVGCLCTAPEQEIVVRVEVLGFLGNTGMSVGWNFPSGYQAL